MAKMAGKKWNLRAQVFNAIRKICRFSPMFRKCKNDAATWIEYMGKTKMVKRRAWICAICKKPHRKVEVDHVNPCVPIEGLPIQANGEPDYNMFIERTVCATEGLRCLCHNCHSKVSKLQNSERRKTKPKKKKRVETNERKPKKPTPIRRGRKQPNAQRRTKRHPGKSRR